MMMKAFWWEFIKMKVKLGVLRISDLIWYRTMGSASCFQIDDHLLKNQEKWCFNSGKIHDWHNSWRGVSILVIMAESWRTRSVATFWIIQAFFSFFNNESYIAWNGAMDTKEIISFQPHLGRHGL